MAYISYLNLNMHTFIIYFGALRYSCSYIRTLKNLYVVPTWSFTVTVIIDVVNDRRLNYIELLYIPYILSAVDRLIVKL